MDSSTGKPVRSLIKLDTGSQLPLTFSKERENEWSDKIKSILCVLINSTKALFSSSLLAISPGEYLSLNAVGLQSAVGRFRFKSTLFAFCRVPAKNPSMFRHGTRVTFRGKSKFSLSSATKNFTNATPSTSSPCTPPTIRICLPIEPKRSRQ